MLAWVHQAVAGEREFLEGFFGVEGDGRMVGSVRRNVGSLALAATTGQDGAADGAGSTIRDRKTLARERLAREDQVEKERLVREVLDRCLEGCCRPLRVRLRPARWRDGRSGVPFDNARLARMLTSLLLKPLFLLDTNPAYDSLAGRRHHGLQSRQPAAVLPADDEAHARRGRAAGQDAARVRPSSAVALFP